MSIGLFRWRGELLQGNHEPIIDKDQWEREELQARLDAAASPDLDALLDLLARASKRTVLRNLRKASLDAQLEFLGALFEAVDVQKGVLTVRYAGGLVPPAEVEL